MQTTDKQFKPIVIKDLVREKNPKLAARLPWFVYSIINRLIHIREINDILKNHCNLRGIGFIATIFKQFKIEFVFNGVENLPKEGRFIFASNHPLGGFDGLLLLYGVDKYVGKSLFLVRDELTKIPQFAELFIPINKHGGQRKSAALINEAYESDNQILIFPSGMASRKINGIITDLPWNKHFIQKSIEHQRDVIPVHIEGRNSSFFYWLANFRKKIGIKFNIEMFLLADEMFKQQGKTFASTFGKPLPWQHFDHSKTATDWASEVRKNVYQLAPKVKKD